MKTAIHIFALFLLLAGIGLLARADPGESVSLALSPAAPSAGDTVTARAILLGADAGQTTFTWLVNGRAVPSASGKGNDAYTFTLSADPQTTVSVTAETSDGARLSATRAISGEGASIVWWADTSVPAWYEGKATPSTASTVTVYAIPSAAFGESPDRLNYFWTLNTESHPEVSGQGKNIFALNTSLAEGVIHQVSVRIANQSQTMSEEATVLIPVRGTELLLYALSPTGGANIEQTLSLFTGAAGGAYDVIAVPFFFRPDQIANGSYAWTVNDQPITGAFARPNVLTLNAPGGQPSEARVSVSFSGNGKNPQNAQASFTAHFQ